MGQGSSGDREGRMIARTVSELLVGNGAAEVDRRFRKKEACRLKDSKRAILFQVIFVAFVSGSFSALRSDDVAVKVWGSFPSTAAPLGFELTGSYGFLFSVT